MAQIYLSKPNIPVLIDQLPKEGFPKVILHNQKKIPRITLDILFPNVLLA
jgi:hypothetical protein